VGLCSAFVAQVHVRDAHVEEVVAVQRAIWAPVFVEVLFPVVQG
jgi:hypothetical protein